MCIVKVRMLTAWKDAALSPDNEHLRTHASNILEVWPWGFAFFFLNVVGKKFLCDGHTMYSIISCQ